MEKKPVCGSIRVHSQRKKFTKVFIKANIHRGSGNPCTQAYSWHPPTCHIFFFCISLAFTSLPFSHWISLTCTTFFQPSPIRWLLQHLLCFWAAGSISQIRHQQHCHSQVGKHGKVWELCACFLRSPRSNFAFRSYISNFCTAAERSSFFPL